MEKYYRNLILAAVATVSSMGVYAQKTYTKLGDDAFKGFDFKLALTYYGNAIRKDSSNSGLRQKIADSYRLMNDWENAEKWYALAANDQGLAPENKLYYAEALRANQKYAEAKPYYTAYLAAKPDDASVKERLNGLDQVKELAKDKGLYNLELMSINSPKQDFGPAFFKDGKILFCSNRESVTAYRKQDNWTQANFLQIYETETDGSGNSVSSKPIKGKANGKYHEGPSSFNPTLNELYITRSNYVKRKPSSSADKTVKLKIFKLSYLQDKGTFSTEITEAVPFNDKEYSVSHPSLSADGKQLYFASDKPGGLGGVDIYVAERQIGGTWGVPVNLGPSVNTQGDEMFPFFSADSTLYFSSNGHTGLGGLDVYSTRKSTAGDWTKGENLGYPINTNKDDFGYIIEPENKFGYLVSNRPGGIGEDDIYRFVRKGVVLNVLVYDAKTKAPIKDSRVVLYEDKDEKGSKLTADKGDVTFAASPKKLYHVYAEKTGYLPTTVDAEVGDKSTTVQIPLQQQGGLNLEVTVLDKKTREVLENADVRIVNMTTNIDQKQKTNATGKVNTEVEPNTNYRIEAGKEIGGQKDTKYLTVSSSVSTVGKKAPATLYVTLELEKVRRGVPIKVENIYYDLDKWNIRPDAAKELDKLVKILLDNPTMQIELSSHTDCRATVEYNRQLSTKRAESAVAYIISRGVNKNRLVAAGYGESRLINDCECEGTKTSTCTEEQHQENRRTEFKILKF